MQHSSDISACILQCLGKSGSIRVLHQRSILARALRDIERKIERASESIQVAFREPLHRANRLLNQSRNSNNRLLSWHAPESRGHRQGRGGRVLGVWREGLGCGHEQRELCHWLPFHVANASDGDAFAETLEQTEILAGVAPKRCYVDRWHKGAAIPGAQIFRSGQQRGLNTRALEREIKRRSAVETAIGSMKTVNHD